MNIIDKAISIFSPEKAAKRELARAQMKVIEKFNNSGYSESGASRSKKALKGWNARSGSPREDIDANLDLLRQRSRSLWMSAPLAVSAVKTNRTNIIGSGLKLKSSIDFEFLGLNREQAKEWEMQVEREFSIWADSKWCDAQRQNSFYELQQIALVSWLLNGEVFVANKMLEPSSWMPYGIRLHLIEADRISNPKGITETLEMKAANGNKIINGIEVNNDGAVEAYHICNQYPNNISSLEAKNWIRVEAFGGKTGRPNILHIFEAERCEQYRGVPYLAPVIETLKQISRYTEAELMAAVITAYLTVFIEVENNQSDIPFGEAIPEGQRVDDDVNSYELGAGTINVLAPNEKVNVVDPKRPASGFDPFVNAMARQIGAALEIPYELLMKAFTASYSASRAAMLEAWKAFRMRRTWFSNDFCQPVYELWLAEAIARGRIKAPGFFNDPVIAKAWSKAEWNGPAPGQIDPVKEVNAAVKRVESGFSTRERETIELTGGDWDRNVEQITRENGKLKIANDILQGGEKLNE